MLLVHAADLHLGSPLGGLSSRDDLPVDFIRSAPMRALERLADLCIDRKADVLVIAGDLFDREADQVTMRAAGIQLRRISDAGTDIVAITGNHDALSRQPRRLPALERLHLLPNDAPDTVSLPERCIALHGRGFESQHVSENLALDYPAATPGVLNVGVLHTSLTGAPGHDNYAPCTLADLAARGYDYWALGHVHKRTVYGEDPWVIHSGNPQGRDIGETGAHGITLVEYEDGHVVGKPAHEDLDDLRWHHVEDITLDDAPDDTAADLIGRIAERLAGVLAGAPTHTHVARITITGKGAAHHELMEAPAHWRGQLEQAMLDIDPEQLYLEQVRWRTEPQLPPIEELLDREDFVGDAARAFLADPDAADFVPLDAEQPIAHLKSAIDKVAGELKDEFDAQPTSDEVAAARELLVGRLQYAFNSDVETAS